MITKSHAQMLVERIDQLTTHLDNARDAALTLLDADSTTGDREAAKMELIQECGDAVVEVAALLPLLDVVRNA